MKRKTKHTYCFGIRTRLARAVGKDGRYACGAIRALPSPHRQEVVLQATDGKQAVCLLTSGELTGSRLVPSDVLPTRQLSREAVVKLVDGHWQSSEGKLAQDTGEGNFPPIGDILPPVSRRPHCLTASQAQKYQQAHRAMPHVVLGVDLELLNKQAMALGTPRLTLLIPIPVRGAQTRPGETFVTKPICVCPADGQGPVNGVGVLMPLTPERSIRYYEQLRQAVVEAEHRIEPRPQTGRRAPQVAAR